MLSMLPWKVLKLLVALLVNVFFNNSEGNVDY